MKRERKKILNILVPQVIKFNRIISILLIFSKLSSGLCSVYESELAPENYKQAAKQNPRAVPVASEKHVLESSIRNDIKKQKGGTSSSKTMTESEQNNAYGAVSDATQTIASRIADLSVDTSGPTDTSKDSSNADSSMEGRVHGQSNSPSKWGKGVSVTEYLMKKLEPGEAEKALSQVITEKITPTRSPRGVQVGMVERIKGAVTSFLLTEEPSSDLEIKRNLPPVNAPNSYSNASSSSGASASISPTKKSPSPRKLVYKPQNPSSPNYIGNSSSHNARSITKEKSTSNTNSSSHVSMSNSAHSGKCFSIYLAQTHKTKTKTKMIIIHLQLYGFTIISGFI